VREAYGTGYALVRYVGVVPGDDVRRGWGYYRVLGRRRGWRGFLGGMEDTETLTILRGVLGLHRGWRGLLGEPLNH
jgi:hypothetical protein